MTDHAFYKFKLSDAFRILSDLRRTAAGGPPSCSSTSGGSVQGAIQGAVLMMILSQAPTSLPSRKRDDFSRDQHVFSPLSHHQGGL